MFPCSDLLARLYSFHCTFIQKTKFLRLRLFSCCYSAILLCELWLLDKKSWKSFLYIIFLHVFLSNNTFLALSSWGTKKWDWWVPRLCRWYCWFFLFPHSLRRKVRRKNVCVCVCIFFLFLGRHSSLVDDYLYKLLLYISKLGLYVLITKTLQRQ